MNIYLIIGFVALIIVSYLIGNINFAILLSRTKKKDITTMGSGNPGTMNMLRNFGFKLGALTLLLDALKSAIPCLVGLLVFSPYGFGYEALYSAGIACVLGHSFPVFRKFKGGKGMASAVGIFMVADPIFTIICFVVAFIYLYFFDYGAVASFIVLTAMAVIEGMKNISLTVNIFIFVLFALVFFLHRSNISRLLIGKEGKIHLQRALKKIGAKKTVKERYKDNKEEKKRDIG